MALISSSYKNLTCATVYTVPHDLKMEVILPGFNHTDLPCESCATLVDNAKYS